MNLIDSLDELVSISSKLFIKYSKFINKPRDFRNIENNNYENNRYNSKRNRSIEYENRRRSNFTPIDDYYMDNKRGFIQGYYPESNRHLRKNMSCEIKIDRKLNNNEHNEC